MALGEYLPGEPAPGAGVYEELNIFGSPTGRVRVMAKDEALPDAARGFSWRPLASRSLAELRARATEYRRMAETAQTITVADSLRALSKRLDALADQKENETKT